MVSKYDYEWEVYPVHTEDGYELHMFRLLGPTHVEPIEPEPHDEVIHPEGEDVEVETEDKEKGDSKEEPTEIEAK